MADDDDNGNSTGDQWLVVADSLAGGKKVALVAQNEDGVVAFLPFYDPRDANYDGTVSLAEKLAAFHWLGKFATQASMGHLMRVIANDDRVNDVALDMRGFKTVVDAASVAIHEAITEMYLDKIGEAAGELATLRLELHWAAEWFIKTGVEKTFNKMLHKVVDSMN